MEESLASSNGDAVETTMELPFLAPAETTKHRLHPGLGQKAQVFYIAQLLVPVKKPFCSSPTGGKWWPAFKPQRTLLPCAQWSLLGCGKGGAVQGHRDLAQKHWYHCLQRQQKGLLKKTTSFNMKPRICACHLVFVWHSSVAVIFCPWCCLHLEEGLQPWNRGQLLISHS